MSQRLRAWWVPIKQAKAFVRRVHRHHPPPQGAIFSLGAFVDETMVGVVMVGRPSSRQLMRAPDGRPRAEVTRLAADEGSRNVCSFLYRRARRVAQAMGFDERFLTYTLLSESGASLRASGFEEVAITDGGSWDRPSRPRTDKHPTERKRRWEARR